MGSDLKGYAATPCYSPSKSWFSDLGLTHATNRVIAWGYSTTTCLIPVIPTIAWETNRSSTHQQQVEVIQSLALRRCSSTIQPLFTLAVSKAQVQSLLAASYGFGQTKPQYKTILFWTVGGFDSDPVILERVLQWPCHCCYFQLVVCNSSGQPFGSFVGN